MCATFQLNLDDSEEMKNIVRKIDEKYGDHAADEYLGRDYFPANETPVIGPDSTVSLLKWGFPMIGTKSVVFNARAESLAQKNMFKSSLGKRCLVPASAFYEWDREKIKYRIACPDHRLFYMAGLWKAFLSPSGEKEFRFTIITTAPNEQVGQIHSRMPALIPRTEMPVWFDADTETALRLLRPYDDPLEIRTA